jgi:hypothetical protein
MRTTLDIDDDVLEAAKELAKREKKTAGAVISERCREGLRARRAEQTEEFTIVDGIPVLASRGGLVTSELVERLLLQADFEDAGIEPRD